MAIKRQERGIVLRAQKKYTVFNFVLSTRDVGEHERRGEKFSFFDLGCVLVRSDSEF